MIALPVLLVAAIVATACGGGAPGDGSRPTAYSGILSASEFVVGANRFPFGLVSRDGEFLEGAEVSVGFFSLNQPEPAFLAERAATWRTIQGVTPHEHEGGEVHLHPIFQGVYVVDEIGIPDEGIWSAEFTAVAADGRKLRIEGTAFEVLPAASAPAVGERVPASRHLTIHDVASFAELSTRAVADDLHNVSVVQALGLGEPFVVFFASPQFCVSAMCGPVTDTLEQAHDQLGGAVEFIHIEPWDLNAAREEGRLVRSPLMDEWRLPTEPWTFVIGSDGRVIKRFEGLVTVEETLAALEPLLG